MYCSAIFTKQAQRIHCNVPTCFSPPSHKHTIQYIRVFQYCTRLHYITQVYVEICYCACAIPKADVKWFYRMSNFFSSFIGPATACNRAVVNIVTPCPVHNNKSFLGVWWRVFQVQRAVKGEEEEQGLFARYF